MPTGFEYVVLTVPYASERPLSERLTEEVNCAAQYGWRCVYGPALQSGPMNSAIWTATMERPRDWSEAS